MKYFLITIILITAIACKKKNNPSQDSSFQKTALLTQLVDHFINPSFSELSKKNSEFENQFNEFKANPTEAQLNAVKETWKASYLSFQQLKQFDFGPSMNNHLNMSLGTFPTDTLQIEKNIAIQNYDLSAISNYDAIGFPAFDHLLFSQTASQLASNKKRQKYVSDLITKLRSDVEKTAEEWKIYRSTFIDGTNNASTSPFSIFVNAFLKDYENIKWNKLGYALGVNTGLINPKYLEGRNSKIGKELLSANLQALENVYLGKGLDGNKGQSLNDYLIELEKRDIALSISNQWTEFQKQISNLDANLETQLMTNKTALETLYNNLNKTTILLKTDMVGAFGVLITYSDNDGD